MDYADYDEPWMRYQQVTQGFPVERLTAVIYHGNPPNFKTHNPSLIHWILIKESGTYIKIYDVSEQKINAIIDETFPDNWRIGKEIHQIVISQILYQVSPETTESWFFNPWPFSRV